MKELKATVKEVTPLVDAEIGKTLGKIKYVSVTFAVEGAQANPGPVVRAEFKEPVNSSQELERDDHRLSGVISFAMEFLRLPFREPSAGKGRKLSGLCIYRPRFGRSIGATRQLKSWNRINREAPGKSGEFGDRLVSHPRNSR